MNTLRVGSMVDKSEFEMIEMKVKDKLHDTVVPMNESNSASSRRNSGFTLRFQQFRAMVMKKVIFSWRKWGLIAGKVYYTYLHTSKPRPFAKPNPNVLLLI